jgi:hypothetical protein
LLLLVPTGQRERIRDLVSAMETKVGAYVAGQGILCLVIGILALVAYLLIGLPYPLVLALVAGVMEAVPMVGPLLGAIPAAVIALSIAPSKLVWVIVATIVIQQVENSLLVPRVMRKAVGVNPFVSLLALFAFSSLPALPARSWRSPSQRSCNSYSNALSLIQAQWSRRPPPAATIPAGCDMKPKTWFRTCANRRGSKRAAQIKGSSRPIRLWMKLKRLPATWIYCWQRPVLQGHYDQKTGVARHSSHDHSAGVSGAVAVPDRRCDCPGLAGACGIGQAIGEAVVQAGIVVRLALIFLFCLFWQLRFLIRPGWWVRDP